MIETLNHSKLYMVVEADIFFLTKWLTDWTDWLNDWLIDWLYIDYIKVNKLIC